MKIYCALIWACFFISCASNAPLLPENGLTRSSLSESAPSPCHKYDLVSTCLATLIARADGLAPWCDCPLCPTHIVGLPLIECFTIEGVIQYCGQGFAVARCPSAVDFYDKAKHFQSQCGNDGTLCGCFAGYTEDAGVCV